MSQPRLCKRSRARWNAAMSGSLGAKKALALRTGVDQSTITRGLQPRQCPGALGLTAEVFCEMQALLCALGQPDVLEREINSRLVDDGLHVRVLVDIDEDDIPKPAPLDVIDSAIVLLNAARKTVDSSGRGLDRTRPRDVRQAHSALGAVLSRLERTNIGR